MQPVAKADEKYTAPRIEDLARRAARSETSDDYDELLAAQASLMDAHDGDMGRLAARLRDSAVVLTLEERQFLADHLAGKIVRGRGAPKQLRVSHKRNLAKRFLASALEIPGKTTDDVIAETHEKFGKGGLSTTVLRELIGEVKELAKFLQAKHVRMGSHDCSTAGKTGRGRAVVFLDNPRFVVCARCRYRRKLTDAEMTRAALALETLGKTADLHEPIDEVVKKPAWKVFPDKS
jgi:hypothetical protein